MIPTSRSEWSQMVIGIVVLVGAAIVYGVIKTLLQGNNAPFRESDGWDRFQNEMNKNTINEPTEPTINPKTDQEQPPVE